MLGSMQSFRRTEILFLSVAVSFPSAALAHGSGLMFLLGIANATIAFLISTVIWVAASPKGERLKQALVACLFAPVWALLFFGPWLLYESEFRKFEDYWLSLPVFLHS
jgi:hypothetical protein